MEEPSEQKPEAPPKQQQQEVCNFVKRTNRNRNMRKREKPEEEEEEDEESSVVQKSKVQKKPDNSLHFSTSREKAPEREAFYFESSKEIQVESDSRATATLETETDFSKDARAIRERQLKQAEQDLKSQDSSENLYKGMNQYKDHLAGFRREHTVAGGKAGGAHGPLRASAHIRTSVRFDYQPDICKDYKETGYCGYGDSCKFMHDRGDYKSGWQLERDWQESQKMKRDALVRGGRGGEDSDDGDSDDEELPFACFICREPFEEPVITKCRHYFCQHCALKHYARNKNCFVCNKPTNGVFNTAHEILRKMGQDKAAPKKKN